MTLHRDAFNCFIYFFVKVISAFSLVNCTWSLFRGSLQRLQKLSYFGSSFGGGFFNSTLKGHVLPDGHKYYGTAYGCPGGHSCQPKLPANFGA